MHNMPRIPCATIGLLLLTVTAMAEPNSNSACRSATGVALQVLGSGGPIADDGRASAGYLVWVNGEAKIMIDAGGGTFLRFGEAGAKFTSLDFIGLSHFHTDHTADFPALLKSGSFSNRQRSLIVTGPDAGGPFPGLNSFLNSILDKRTGAYGYLGGYLDGTGGLQNITALEISRENVAPVTVLGDLSGPTHIQALHVPHGIVPALAFRVRIGHESIVFASDQNGDDPAFVEFAKNASVLLMHMPVPEGISGVGRRLHAPPGIIGEIAKTANVGTLVLSHFMARSLQDLDENIAIVRSKYDGRVIVASDLDCIPLSK